MGPAGELVPRGASGGLTGLRVWSQLSRCPAEDGRVKRMGLETDSRGAPGAFSAGAGLLYFTLEVCSLLTFAVAL